MVQAIQGFATIWIVIGVGWLLAHLRIVGPATRRFLSHFSFMVASPPLLTLLVSRADLSHLFSSTLIVNLLAIVAAALTYLIAARLVFRPGIAGGTVGTLLSCYTNAGNLGLPVATYVLGDGSWVAPIMLLQIAVMQPLGLAVLDSQRARAEGRTISKAGYLTLPFRNPITVGVLAGLALGLGKVQLPTLVSAPMELVGAMAVPMMLIAFGASLRLDPLPGRSPHTAELWTIQAIKVVLHPLVAYLLAAAVFRLTTPQVLAVTVLAALPAAQNIYINASRYHVRELLARDAIFVSTLLCVPVIFLASTVLR